MKYGISRAARRAWLTGASALVLTAFGGQVPAAPQYRLTHQVKLPGDEGWDYLTFEQGGHRLFIAHGTQVQVLDTELLAVTGIIADTPGVHGIALAPDVGHGYVSAGRSNSIVVFDLKSLARLKEIKASGENPDAIIYDAPTQRVFAFNGRGRNATVIDAKTDEVVGTIALDAKPEFAVSDGKGHVYVNLEDKGSLAQIDAQRQAVTAVWKIEGCEEPSGLAMDVAGQRLFAGCGNKVMAVVDAVSGRTLGTAPIGAGVDATAYDPHVRLAFASCGEGVLTVIAVSASGAPEVAQSLTTQRGARTMALDEGSHRIFLVTSSFRPPAPASAANPHPRPQAAPGSFRLLVVEPGRVVTAAASGGAHP